MVQFVLNNLSKENARACRNSLLWYNRAAYRELLTTARACRNSLLWYNKALAHMKETALGLVGIPCYGTILKAAKTSQALARACRNSLLWYNESPQGCNSTSARACRNSLLWYNSVFENPEKYKLGLVGIPCYGTMRRNTTSRSQR